MQEKDTQVDSSKLSLNQFKSCLAVAAHLRFLFFLIIKYKYYHSITVHYLPDNHNNYC